MSEDPDGTPSLFVDRFFRTKWGEIVAALTRRFGTEKLDDVENAVQSAMLKALDTWQLNGIPDNPGGWIYTAARNSLLDGLRSATLARNRRDQVAGALYEADGAAPDWLGPLDDEVIEMIFVCCHPALNTRDSVLLTLRLVCGLGIREIAAATYHSYEAVRKSLTRTKAHIRGRGIPLAMPGRAEQAARTSRVLQVLYLLFNEGYSPRGGNDPIRRDLCQEAQRLCGLLGRSHLAQDGRVWALAALMAFQISRFGERIDENGLPKLLSRQDRSRWDGQQIRHGFSCLDRSMAAPARSTYHLEAAIAACHAIAPDYEATDWRRVLEFYDDLLALAPSPAVELNRAVAVMMVEGVAAGLALLETLKDREVLENDYLLPAVFADFHARAGQCAQAEICYRQALDMVANRSIRALLREQLGAINQA